MIEYRNSAFVYDLLVLVQVLEQSGVSRDDFPGQAGFARTQFEDGERSLSCGDGAAVSAKNLYGG